MPKQKARTTSQKDAKLQKAKSEKCSKDLQFLTTCPDGKVAQLSSLHLIPASKSDDDDDDDDDHAMPHLWKRLKKDVKAKYVQKGCKKDVKAKSAQQVAKSCEGEKWKKSQKVVKAKSGEKVSKKL